MIVLPANSLRLYVVGLTDCRIVNPDSSLKDLRSRWPTLQLQLLRADRIAGSEHLQFAARNAVRSYYSMEKRAKSLAVEFLLYVSCTHQISKAIERLGVTKKTRNIVLATFAEEEKDIDGLEKEAARVTRGHVRDSVLEVSEGKVESLMRVYGVTERELEAAREGEENTTDVLKRLIIERSALVALEN